VAENNSNNIKVNAPVKGLVTDFSKFNLEENVWTYARNVRVTSHLGDMLHIENEPATKFCVDLPYLYLGSIKLKNGRFIIATTDNKNSELGIFDSKECTYTKVVNNQCLNFNSSFPIFGVSKINSEGQETIYFVDGQRNEIRVLNLDKIPYTYRTTKDGCKTKVYTNILDCNEISYTKRFTVPTLHINSLNTGFLANGAYQLAIAYATKGQRLTDYYGVTNPLQIWNHGANTGAISVTITGLDRDFDSYKLMLIATINNITTYYELGDFNITQTSHVITKIKPEHTPVLNKEVAVKNTYYQKADNIVANDKHLIILGPSIRHKLDYQRQAMSIVSEYVVAQAPLDYYRLNNEAGHYRDETYPYAIQWLYDDGEWSDLFHIPGRRATEKELEQVYGADVVELKDNCDTIKTQKYWQVYNTAGKPTAVSSKEVCNLKVIATGQMAYHESTELYPDNKDQYGDRACTPINHHTFPDECITPRYTKTKEGVKINILGIRFKNIQHPVDEKGKKITSIVGYRIWRGDRSNNKKIIARGIATNVRSYKDKNKDTIKYTNYPFNDLTSDQLLSEKQTYLKLKEEKGYVPLTTYYDNEFTFFSPHTFFDHIGLGNHIKFETVETATVQGFFEEVYKHPKGKLISNNVLAFALLIGAVDGYLKAVTGQKTEIKYADGAITTAFAIVDPPSAGTTVQTLSGIKAVQQIASALNSWGSITAGTATIGASKYILKALEVLGKAGAFVYFAAESAQKVLEAFYNFSSWKQYALQYNGHAFFNTQSCIKKEQKIRRLDYYQYLSTGMNAIQDRSTEKYNNLYKENNVFLRLNSGVEDIKGDKSRVSISKNGLCGNIFSPIQSKAAVFYATIKNTFPSQYGQLDSIIYLATSGKYNKTDLNQPSYTSDVVYGGDCYINRFSFNNRTDFFYSPLYDQPDGVPFDYRSVNALAYPRYWVDFHQYDFSEIVPSSIGKVKDSYKNQSNLPMNKYNLDCRNKKGLALVKDQYFYTSYNGVFDFIVESDYNLELRDWKESTPDFYTKNSNLSALFKNKGEERHIEEFIYDKSYSKQLNDEFFYQFPFTPEKLRTYFPNAVAFSSPAQQEASYDNWLSMPPINYFEFNENQLGNLTAVKTVDSQQVMFLFDNASPYITPGRQELKTTDDSVIYLGDSTLIRDPRPLVTTEDNYGSCQSRFALIQNKFGLFYPSQRKGNWFQFTKNLDDLSKKGMYYWFNMYLPSFLLKQFPTFVDKDNPMHGVGLLSSYDPTYETAYLTKKDYEVKPEYLSDITYDKVKNRFLYKGVVIPFKDPKYFNDISYTISYHLGMGFFVSWHDYQPVAYLPTEDHFMSVINEDSKSSIHKHNEVCDLFSNFYGKDYPHAFEVNINNGQTVNILKSIEYQADTLVYGSNCKDFFQLLDTTYDIARISNQEQISGNLHLNIKAKNSMKGSLLYDTITFNPSLSAFEIYVDKSEQKHRFNKFADITKDRGEFTMVQEPLILTDNSGYRQSINLNAVSYDKSIYERKKIRNTQTRLYLEKTISGRNSHKFYLTNSKQLNSPR